MVSHKVFPNNDDGVEKKKIDILAGLANEVAVPTLKDPCGGAHLLKTHLYHHVFN